MCILYRLALCLRTLSVYIDEKNILEEVIYTISLSMNNIYNNLEKVSFYVNEEEVHVFNFDDIN